MVEFDLIKQLDLLYDFYAPLLTEKQRLVWEMYYQEDLSLGEIAEDQGITRQAVHDLIRRSEKALQSYEQRLGLVERFAWQSRELAHAYELVKAIGKTFDSGQATEIISILEKVLYSEAPTGPAESGD
ncbi:MAG: YlxM family DNA-binding protein [Methylocystaceae bacterium]